MNERRDLAWEEVSTRQIVKNEWIDFRQTAYRFPDGSVFEPFYSYSRKDYVVIVATNLEGNFICVRQFRPGIRKVTTEFPAGCLERTDGGVYMPGEDNPLENPLDAAKRELLEETGHVAREWNHLLTIPANASIADNYAHIFRAKDCVRISEQKLDETEFLNVELHSPLELEEMIREGCFEQNVHVMAWLLARETVALGNGNKCRY